MTFFNPFLKLHTNYIEELITEIVTKGNYRDAGEAVTSIEMVICILANFMRAYAKDYMFEINFDKECCEGLQRELLMTWINYTYITKTIDTMLELGYIDKTEDNYYYMTSCCPLAELNLKVYNRLEQN
jgi:hypothetical protein